jgi:hypothetical protein
MSHWRPAFILFFNGNVTQWLNTWVACIRCWVQASVPGRRKKSKEETWN